MGLFDAIGGIAGTAMHEFNYKGQQNELAIAQANADAARAQASNDTSSTPTSILKNPFVIGGAILVVIVIIIIFATKKSN